MKTPSRIRPSRESLAATALYNARWFAGLVVGTAATMSVQAQTLADWNGSADSNWTNADNWNGGAVPTKVPGNQHANISAPAATPPAHWPIVNADIGAPPVDIFVGRGAGNIGVYTQTAGNASTGDGNWIYVGTFGGTGEIQLSGGTLVSGGRLHVGGYGNNNGGGTGKVEVSGTGTFNIGGILSIGEWGGSGTFVQDGGLVTVNGEVWVGQAPGGKGVMNISGGTFTNNNWVAIGRRDNEGDENSSVGQVNMSGGTWIKNGGGNFIVGASGVGTMIQTGGLVDVQTGITWIGERWSSVGTLTISGTAEFRTTEFSLATSAGTSGELNLNGGTVKTRKIVGGPGPDTATFNGGQIIVTGNEANFISQLDTATIAEGGLKIDTNGFNIGIPQNLTGPGGIMKSGEGTMTLNGINSFEGDVSIEGGGLGAFAQFLDEELEEYPAGRNITLADDTSLTVTTEFFGDWLPVDGLTLGDGGETTVTFDLGGQVENPFNGEEILRVNTLTLNGETTVNLTNSFPVVGKFPLLTYETLAGTGSLVLGGLPNGVVANLVHDVANKSYYLDITQVALPRWDATVDNIWDTTTANWKDLVTNGPLVFFDGNPVVFNDDVEVEIEEPAVVQLPGTVQPASVVFDNGFVDYELKGDGKISGSGGLTKRNEASLKIETVNDYTGPTSLEGGTVTVDALTNAGQPSPLGAASADPANLVFAGGLLDYVGPAATIDRGFTIAGDSGLRHDNNLTFTGRIAGSGAGNLNKSGAGELKFTHLGNNVFGTSGVFRVKGGKLILDGTGGDQTNVVSNEMWVADTPDVNADLVLLNTSLSMPSWLAISRGNGNNGECNMTVTNSKLQTGNFSTGYNNGLADNQSETFVTLTDSTWTNSGNTYISESAGSSAVFEVKGNTSWTATANVFHMAIGANTSAKLTISDTAKLEVNRFQIAHGADSFSEVIIEDSGSINKSGNSWMSIGNSSNGEGILTVRDNGSFINSAGDFNISDVDTSKGTLNIQDNATVTSGGTVFIGKGNSGGDSAAEGYLNQSGGTFDAAGWVSIARYGSGTIGELNVSGGAFNQNGALQRLIVGEQGIAKLTVSGTGVVTVNGLGVSVAQGAEANGTVTLNTGGVLAAREVVELAGGGTSQVVFDGGTLRAIANSSNFLSVDSATIGNGGAIIDTDGNDILIAQPLGGTGGLTKTGEGTLTLSGSLSYTGPTTILEGTLSLTAPNLPDTGSVVIGPNGGLDLPHGGNDAVAALTINNVALGEGTYNATTHPGFISGTGSITVGEVPTTAYDAWADSKGLLDPGQRGPEIDVESDGIPNILEYILGGDPLASDTGILPEPEVTDTHFVFSFERSDESESDTTLTFQWATDLGTWNDVAIGAASSGPDASGVTVEIDEGTPASNPDKVTVRVPKANAAGGKLFGRLSATKP